MACGLNNLIKPFNGEGDVVAWLKKVDLVARLQKIDDVASVIPLFLEGDALALYLEMSEHEQEDADMIRLRLKKAFAEGVFDAYEKLKRVRWSGESVDVYANNIKRLVELAGYRGWGVEQTAKLVFVTGFPEEISKRLQQVEGVEKMDVCELIPTAKVLARTRPAESAAAATVLRGKEDRSERRGQISCFECGGPHLRRDCEKYLRRMTCYKCHRNGHLALNCRYQEDRSRASLSASGTPNVRMMAQAQRTPRISVRVGERRVMALVDTGCTTTMVKTHLVTGWNGSGRVVGFDGRNVKCCGTSNIELELEGRQLSVEAIVNDRLVPGVEAIIGMDVICQLGGVTVDEDGVKFGTARCDATVQSSEEGERKILRRMEKSSGAVNSYINDVPVNETAVAAADVVVHLKKFGLEAKPSEPLDGRAALGLKLKKNKAAVLKRVQKNSKYQMRNHFQMYNRRRDDDGGRSSFFTIAPLSVGAIIGRQGSRIREMENNSGARIKIHDIDDSGDRRVEIIGSPENQNSARLMIEQVLDGYFQDSYGGGYDDGGGRYRGGSGGDSCFECGERGHFVRDCPYGGGMRRGGGGGNCYKCGENGHFARECISRWYWGR